MAPALETPALVCPDCRMQGVKGAARIGNRRRACKLCNAFAQNSMREVRAKLLSLYPEEYQQIRLEIELQLYKKVMVDFLDRFPQAVPKDDE